MDTKHELFQTIGLLETVRQFLRRVDDEEAWKEHELMTIREAVDHRAACLVELHAELPD